LNQVEGLSMKYIPEPFRRIAAFPAGEADLARLEIVIPR